MKQYSVKGVRPLTSSELPSMYTVVKALVTTFTIVIMQPVATGMFSGGSTHSIETENGVAFVETLKGGLSAAMGGRGR